MVIYVTASLGCVARETNTGNNIVANIASVTFYSAWYLYLPDFCYIVAIVSHEPNNLVDSLAGGMPSLALEGMLDCTCQTVEGVDAIRSRIPLY